LNTNHIQSAVQAARLAAGVSVSELARRAEVDRAALSRWLSGRADITTATASRVLAVLGLEVS
jgi:transcriptional regulator with XRE-family HTH domain